MFKLTIWFTLLLLSSSISAGNTPDITIWDKSLKLLEGFGNLSIDTFVNDAAKKCYVKEKALLTKALLAVAQTKIRVEEDGTKADAVLMIGVETTSPSEGYCLSKVSLRLNGLAIAHFEKANLQKYALVPLFENYKLIYTKSKGHYKPVERATNELLNKFIYKWSYFNNSKETDPSNSK